ncbi:MAG: hypothetical protein AB8B92_11340 [Gammaproteobacteria bacterium]
MRLLTLLSVLSCVFPAIAYSGEKELFDFSGDVRFGFFGSDRDDRDGSRTRRDELRARIRAGMQLNLTDVVSGKLRFAGRYGSDSRFNDNHAEIFEVIPSDGGLRLGDSTIDEFYLRYMPNNKLDIRLGRFQTKFELEGVAKKSFSRNDSDNTNITWTDGVHVKYTIPNGWDLHAILQRSKDEGPTTVRRAPLDFEEEDSHITYYFGAEKKAKNKTIIQKGFDITHIPDALQRDGDSGGDIENYTAVSTRLAMQWPIGKSGTKFLWGNELAYAFDIPRESAIGTGGDKDANGLAFQTTFNFVDFWPKHSIGIVYAQSHGGWLISGDYGSNQELFETRYAWAVQKNQKLEIRLRNREDIDKRTSAERKRREWDYYLRYTIKFN